LYEVWQFQKNGGKLRASLIEKELIQVFSPGGINFGTTRHDGN
jgi:hypothetical protein